VSNHTREPLLRDLHVPLLFGNHPLIYMHACVCFAVEYETVCNLVFQVGCCQFFQWEDMMEQMPPIPLVPSSHISVQAVPKVAVLRDKMDRIVDHPTWIEKWQC
jgi:hypothetical protein